LYEIEEALRRIEQGTYGVCEMSGNPIERERLKVLPFARYSVSVQSEIERGKPRFRPFRRTSIQSAEPAT
jgi:RNA polymerase-binding transcription factor DksA